MKSGVRLGLAIIVGLLLGGGIFGLVLRESRVSSRKPTSAPVSTPSVAPKLLTWTDPAGFTFQYPDGLSLNKHDEDNDNYAHLEFTNKDHPGSLIVWAKDTNDPILSSWIKSDKRFVGANIIDTTFAGQDGEKILIATPSNMVVTGTISENILFAVETKLVDADYWNKVHKVISGSFAFTPDKTGQTGGSASGSDEAVDEEETIQ